MPYIVAVTFVLLEFTQITCPIEFIVIFTERIFFAVSSSEHNDDYQGEESEKKKREDGEN